MIRLTHPRPQAGRQKFIGLVFRDGFAEVESLHPEVEASLLQHGYCVEHVEDEPVKGKRRKRDTAPPDPEDPPVSNEPAPAPPANLWGNGEAFTSTED